MRALLPLILALKLSSFAYAEEAAPVSVPVPVNELDSVVESGDLITPDGVRPQEQQGPAGSPRGKRKVAKGSRVRDANKETDGTQARDRFEANTVVKSKYESGGQSLEVDPD